MTVLLLVLALLMLLSGIGLVYYSLDFHPAQLRAYATATVQTIQTVQTHATATVNAQVTGTAVAYAHATATAQVRATAVAAATATALQTIYTQATSSNPALFDPLTGNDGNNWDEGNANGGGGCFFAGGSYHSSMPQKGFYLTCMAESSNVHNFAFQVQMTTLKGDGGGLVFRSSNSNFHAYRFRVGHDGLYALVATLDGQHSSVLKSGASSAINTNPNAPNLLTVIARGSNMYLYINKQYITNVSDGTYSSGQIGMFAEDATNPTEVAFSHAEVWNL